MADCCHEFEDEAITPCCRKVLTAKGDLVREACQEVIDVVNGIRDLADDPDDEFIEKRLPSLMIHVGELTLAVVVYAEPDAGMEPL